VLPLTVHDVHPGNLFEQRTHYPLTSNHPGIHVKQFYVAASLIVKQLLGFVAHTKTVLPDYYGTNKLYDPHYVIIGEIDVE
jgi:hypothetical protein